MGVRKNQSVSRKPITCPRSRTNTPSAPRNQQTPAVKSTCGTSNAGSQTTEAGTFPCARNTPMVNSSRAKVSVTRPDTTRLMGSVSTAKTSFIIHEPPFAVTVDEVRDAWCYQQEALKLPVVNAQ